ncbi:MAG TPA: hypothetical protein VEW28_10560 [Candidatus Kapabacteria bacterium]|nr:hypothetical protein [Candidatus Kapabacteria bacterium]
MVIVRDVFQLKFGMAKDAIAAMKEIVPVMTKEMPNSMRVLVDVTGKSYTMVIEVEYPSLGAYEESMSKGSSDPAMQTWYGKFKPLCESSFKEVFKTVDL